VVIKIFKEAFKAYVDFEKALLQLEMVMGNNCEFATKSRNFDKKFKLEDFKGMNKADLLKHIEDDTRVVNNLRNKINDLVNENQELASTFDGFKTLTEIQKRKLDYYKSELADSKEAYFGLCVNLDMGLQK